MNRSSVPKWYQPLVPEGYEWALPVEPSDFERFNEFGVAQAGTWKPVRMSILRTEGPKGGDRLHADIPWFGGNAIIMRPRARTILGPMCVRDGELLPLSCEGEELVAWNVTNVVDALDVERSELVRYKSSGRIMTVNRYVFREEVLVGMSAFRIPQMNQIYVGEDFVDLVRRSGLTGLEFKEVGAMN